MRKTVLTIFMAVMMPLASVTAQTYSTLWKQVETASNKDLPQTQMKMLRQIESKAEKERAYGHLLKAGLGLVEVQTSVAPDSLRPAVDRLVQKEQQAKDVVLKAIYDAVLYRLYTLCEGRLGDDYKQKAESYRREALAHPEKLAGVKATGFDPFVVNGSDSRYFDNDMLSVVGYETRNYRPLVDYYYKAGNRRATCLAGLALAQTMTTHPGEDYRKSRHIQRLDSLTKVFADLDVAGEVAVERYNYMCECKNVTTEDKIAYIHKALDRWGGWQRMSELRNAEKTLTQPYYSYLVPRGVVLPNHSQTVALKELRNLKQLTLRVYQTHLTGDTELDPANDEDYQKMRKNITLLPQLTQTRSFIGYPDYQTFNDSVTLGALPVGVYMLEIESAPATRVSRQLYYVSNIQALVLPLPGNKIRYAVVDATSGQPVNGASVRLAQGRRYMKENQTPITLRCDSKGEAIYADHGRGMTFQVFAYTDTDKASPAFVHGGQYYYYDSTSKSEHVSVMTDRSLYRPGQTVRVAAVVYENIDKINSHVVAGKQLKASLRGANGKILAEKEVATDEFGTCSTAFVLPSEGLTGNYRVMVGSASTNIKVEEYKRPTFQIEFPKVNEKYQSGDTLLIKGKALTYAGVPVQGAKVKYRVSRDLAFWWMNSRKYGYAPLSQSDETGVTLVEQETTTADDGTFMVEMPLVMPDEENSQSPMFYNFTADATVTDQGGETHSAQLSVPLGSRATVFTADVQRQVLADSLRQIRFQLRNASGLNVNAPVRFYIDDKNGWLEASTAQPYQLTGRLKSGLHHLFAVCENDTLELAFTVFGLDDKRPATNTREWFYCSSDHFDTAGTPVTVQVGSSDRNVHVYYSLFSGEKMLESGTVDLDDALVNRKFVYKDSYGDGIVLTYAWIKEGEGHTHAFRIRRSLPDNKLSLQWTTFRDRLTPGQKEEWTLRVTGPDGKPADAQLMATCYDKSLDQLYPHRWYFGTYRAVNLPSTFWRYAHYRGMNGYGDKTISYQSVRCLNFSHFDMNAIYNLYSFNCYAESVPLASPRLRGLSAKVYSVAASKQANGLQERATVMYKTVGATDENPEEATEESATASGKSDESVSLRANLNETAFFYPALQTDAKGNVTIKFTLPESLTTWNVMGLAHTKNLEYGNLSAEVVARKDVMVQPNVPRFVRQGDKFSVAARIFNTGEKNVDGTAKMELVDPETERVVYSASVPFSVDKGQTSAVNFICQWGGKQSLLICKVTAAGRNFSDGEQHYLPVLPSSERVTVSLPFSQSQAGTKHIDISHLFPKGTEQQKLTVEYTNNPAWLVVQALPSIGDSREDNAIDQCATLYANTLGKAIVNQSPRIKKVFEQWKRENSTENSLQSNLLKNQDLRDIVISETPWLDDANKESEQKQRLADFFDESALQNRLQAAGQRLARLQNANGSWSWWKGMDGSLDMTVAVAEKLVRLNEMAGRQEATQAMLDKALSYMDSEILKEVERMRREEKKGHPQYVSSYATLQYLYLRSLDGHNQSAQVKDANRYLVELIKKNIKSQSIQQKAMSAIILSLHGEKAMSHEYVKSLKEYSVCTEEMGRYYDTPRASYSWQSYKIPTEVAAMEAIKRITPDDRQTLDEMRRWLLQEKHAQAWDTPLCSIDAVYAFLFDHAKILDAQEKAQLSIDGQPLSLPAATAGMGYVKVVADAPMGKTLTVDKTSTGTSWGAVYAQFLQPTAKVENSGNELTVKREVIQPKGELKVGSRVKVRITVESKRDLDFVQVQDKRAACLEPVNTLSGYREGCYQSVKDNVTNYYFDHLSKGRHVIETEFYVDRVGIYDTGTCTAGCAYAPEYRATAKSLRLETVGE